MKKLTLLEVTPDDLMDQQPTAGTEVLIAGVRYRVLNVKALKGRRSKWGGRPVEEQEERYQLLVEPLEGSAVSSAEQRLHISRQARSRSGSQRMMVY